LNRTSESEDESGGVVEVPDPEEWGVPVFLSGEGGFS